MVVGPYLRHLLRLDSPSRQEWSYINLANTIRETVTMFDNTISTILKHDKKNSSYKIALIRAINDVVLSFPTLNQNGKAVAIPLRLLADFWIAYYWPFVDPTAPIDQGVKGATKQDITFRGELTVLRQAWETMIKSNSPSSDGYVLIQENRILRKRKQLTREVLDSYKRANRKIITAIRLPIRYAGAEEYQVFKKPQRLTDISEDVVPIPGTHDKDYCLIVTATLWQAFQNLSLWIEALCIHEWSLFSEKMLAASDLDRGDIYRLLTARPDNRRPLTWERNQIDILLMEGNQFTCPWTEKTISNTVTYDLDHLIPVSIYPTNEMWNLVPADPEFNQHKKRDRLPSHEKLIRARPHLQTTYRTYLHLNSLKQSLKSDVHNRFSIVLSDIKSLPDETAAAVTGFLESVAEMRNVARF